MAGILTSQFPVESFRWDDAQEFCRRLSQKEGKTYRLPTEAEWEYACRAGTTTEFNTGGQLNGTQANLDDRAGNGPFLKRTTKVGSYRPNAFGLYDMHGNICQWCSDWSDINYYSESPQDDPQGQEFGESRVMRGSSWKDSSFECRSANCGRAGSPGYRGDTIGFRVVLPWGKPANEVSAEPLPNKPVKATTKAPVNGGQLSLR